MDVNRTSESTVAQTGQSADLGAERAAALAESRRKLSAEGQRTAEAAGARRAEQIAELRDVVARAVGADTRLAIMRAPEAPVFLYRAIDEATGEVVQEWPRLEFLALSQATRAAAIPDAAAPGSALDRRA